MLYKYGKRETRLSFCIAESAFNSVYHSHWPQHLRLQQYVSARSLRSNSDIRLNTTHKPASQRSLIPCLPHLDYAITYTSSIAGLKYIFKKSWKKTYNVYLFIYLFIIISVFLFFYFSFQDRGRFSLKLWFYSRLLDMWWLYSQRRSTTCYLMAGSVSEQDEPNPALRAGKMAPSWPLGTTRCVPQEKFPASYITDPLLTTLVRSRWLDIGLALFLASLWTSTPSRSINTQKKKRIWPISSHLDLRSKLSFTHDCVTSPKSVTR